MKAEPSTHRSPVRLRLMELAGADVRFRKKKLKTKWKTGVLFALAAISPLGCATEQVRGSKASPPTAVYPAVRTDCEMIGICIDGGTVFHSGGPIAKACGYTLAPLCWFLDMPLSAIADTVCMPKDLWRLKKNRAESNRALQAIATAPQPER